MKSKLYIFNLLLLFESFIARFNQPKSKIVIYLALFLFHNNSKHNYQINFKKDKRFVKQIKKTKKSNYLILFSS